MRSRPFFATAQRGWTAPGLRSPNGDPRTEAIGAVSFRVVERSRRAGSPLVIGGSSRAGRLVRGISFGYVNMAVTLVVGLWLTRFLLGHIGQTQLGMWLVIGQVMTYLGLMDFGIIALLPRETAYAVGRAGSAEQAVDIPEIVGRTIRLVLWQVPFVAVVAATAWFLFPAEVHEAKGPIAWFLVIFVLRFPLRVFPEILVGLQDFSVLGAIQLLGYLATTIATVSLVLADLGLYALVIGWGVGQLLVTGTSWLRLRAAYPFALPKSLPNLPWKSARALLAKGGWVSLAQIAQLLVYGSDVLILGNVLGAAAVVPYACTNKLVSVLQNHPQLVMETARPALSEIRAGLEKSRLHEITEALTLLAMLMGGLIACGIAATNQGFTVLWVGEGLFGGTVLTVALIANMLLRLWNVTAVNAIFAFGYERRISVTTLADGVFTAALAVGLVSWLGLVGAPVASMVSVLVVSLPWNLSALAREGSVSMGRHILGLAGWFVRFAFVFGMAILVGRIMEPHSVAGVALAGLAVTLMYGVVMLPVVRRPPLAGYVRSLLDGIRARLVRSIRVGGASS